MSYASLGALQMLQMFIRFITKDAADVAVAYGATAGYRRKTTFTSLRQLPQTE